MLASSHTTHLCFQNSQGCQTEEDIKQAEEVSGEQEMENEDLGDCLYVDPTWTPDDTQEEIDYITDCNSELPMEEEPDMSTNDPADDSEADKENLNHR